MTISKTSSAGRVTHVVVGFDGSRSALAALERAQDIAAVQEGAHVHVVHVAHVPIGATFSSQAIAGIQSGYGAYAHEVEAAAAEVLGTDRDGWSFEQREGSVAQEIFAAAEAIVDGDEGDLLVVVGAPESAVHRLGGAVAGHLTHQGRFTLVVVPAEPDRS